MVSGVKADLAVKIFGDDFDKLKETGKTIEKILEELGGEDVNVEQMSGQPMLRIKVNQEQLARYGVSARDGAGNRGGAGEQGAGRCDGGAVPRFPLVVRLPEPSRQTPEAIRSIPVLTATGERVALSRLASVETVEGPAKISANRVSVAWRSSAT